MDIVKEKITNLYDEDAIGQYGIVKIIKGEYAGRFVDYDDDDTDIGDNTDKAVIYFSDIIHNSKYIYLDYDYLTTNYTFKDLQDRSIEISRLLAANLSDYERVLLVEEKRLIDSEIKVQYDNFINMQKVNGTKVFLSHSSKDKPTVISLALDLKRNGIFSWLDAFDILPGESIVSKINDGLNECDFVVLFLSKNSVTSNWVKKEWETMLWDEVNSNKVKIIPVKLDECELPKILQTKKYIDMSLDYQSGLFQLIDVIKKYNDMKD